MRARAYRVRSASTAVFVIGINPAPAIQTGQRESLDFSSIFIFLANSVATKGEKNTTRREPYRGSNGEKGGEIKKRAKGELRVRYSIQWKFYPTEN